MLPPQAGALRKMAGPFPQIEIQRVRVESNSIQARFAVKTEEALQKEPFWLNENLFSDFVRFYFVFSFTGAASINDPKFGDTNLSFQPFPVSYFSNPATRTMHTRGGQTGIHADIALLSSAVRAAELHQSKEALEQQTDRLKPTFCFHFSQLSCSQDNFLLHFHIVVLLRERP